MGVLYVKQLYDFVILYACHSFGGNHLVYDGLLGGLHSGSEDGPKLVVGQHSQIDDMVRSGRAGIGGREGDEDVSGAVAGDAAVAAEAERNPAREAFELMRDERRVRRNNDDD